VGAYLLFTLAAQLTTLPLVWHYTGDLSLSALVANPLILPAQPMVMILGGIATLLGLLSTTLGQWAAYLAWPFLAYTIRTVEWVAGFPGGVLHLGNLSMSGLILFYVILFVWTLHRWLKAKEKEALVNQNEPATDEKKAGWLTRTWQELQARPWLPLVGLALLTLLIWRQALSAPDGKLQVTVLNVGSGEAIYIQTPGGRNLLVNGGLSGLALADALGRRLPPGDRQFDWWVIGNGDEESVAGLPFILERYPPDQVLWAGATHGTYASRQLWEDLTKAELPIVSAETGQVLDLGDGATLEVLRSGKRGAILLLTYGNFSLFLPVGANIEALVELQDEIQPVSALLLADSGYAPLNSPEWLEPLNPQVVLLSVAADDREGLPDAEVLEALQGHTLLRTDQNGWIELTTDGEQMWVEVERK
jgi:competence protein ComEC